MKKALKDSVFPTPKGWSERQNDEAIKALLGLVLMSLIILALFGALAWISSIKG